MRKRNSLNYEIIQSVFDPDSDAENGGSFFRIKCGTESETINFPTSIMHRLFRLGQAYGLRQLRYFESGKVILVGTVELPDFLKELDRLLSLVNDEVLHEQVKKIIDELQSEPGISKKSVFVSTGDYFNKRT